MSASSSGRLFTLSLQSLLLRQRPVLIARTHLYQLGARAVRSPSRRPHDLLLPGDIVNPDRETLMDINEWGNVRRLQDWVGKTRWTRGSIVVAAAVREGFALFLLQLFGQYYINIKNIAVNIKNIINTMIIFPIDICAIPKRLY